MPLSNKLCRKHKSYNGRHKYKDKVELTKIFFSYYKMFGDYQNKEAELAELECRDWTADSSKSLWLWRYSLLEYIYYENCSSEHFFTWNTQKNTFINGIMLAVLSYFQDWCIYKHVGVVIKISLHIFTTKNYSNR